MINCVTSSRPGLGRMVQADKLVGGSDAVLVIDDTAIPKKGTYSVGVAPQYASALGKTANCQPLVSISLAAGKFRSCVRCGSIFPRVGAAYTGSCSRPRSRSGVSLALPLALPSAPLGRKGNPGEMKSGRTGAEQHPFIPKAPA
jgi:hypothetical protein